MTRSKAARQFARGRACLPCLRTSLLCTSIAIGMLAAVSSAPLAANAQSQAYSLIPRPAVVDARRGQFNLLRTTSLRAPELFHAVAHRFARDIANATDFDLSVKSAGTETRNVIILRRDHFANIILCVEAAMFDAVKHTLRGIRHVWSH